MIKQLQESLWRQFGASVDMLAGVIANCPDNYFFTNKRFYYLAYHSVLLLDYYLTIPPDKFLPTLPFSIKDADERPAEAIGDIVPDKLYTKDELLSSVNASRLKCERLIESLTNPEKLNIRFTEGDQESDMDYPILEILLYNLRHTQHHVGQLNLLVRQDLGKHISWAFRVAE